MLFINPIYFPENACKIQDPALKGRRQVPSRPGKSSSVGGSIRLAVIDAYPLMIDGLKRLFENVEGVEVLATGSSLDDALEIISRFDPNVLLLDGDLEPNGLDPLKAIFDSDWTGKVILHASSLDHDRALEAFSLGIPGVILKTMPTDLLVQCVRRINDGHQWLEKDSLSQVLEVILRRQNQAQKMEARLTPREAEIVPLAATGLTNKKIAHRLSISPSTVKAHLHNIYEKLDLSGRWELSRFAHDHELH